MKRFCALLLFVQTSLGFDYYVATNGSDAFPGTQINPFATIKQGIIYAIGGDTVHVGPGVYTDYLTNHVSGVGSPITFVGTRGPNNEWLTIVDPSTPLTNGWVAAPEAGPGVYKHTTVPFETKELLIDHQRVAAVYTVTNSSEITSAYYSSGLSNGLQVLALPSDFTVQMSALDPPVSFWESLRAMWGSTGTVTYLRLRDGSDPNGLNIRVAPNKTGLWSTFPGYQNVLINGQFGIVWSNFWFRGAFCGFFLDGGAHDVTIANNLITGGKHRIYFENSISNCVISSNVLTCNFYGTTNLGAWNPATETTSSLLRQSVYRWSKYGMGEGTSFDDDIRFYLSGSSNVIAGNLCYGSIGSSIVIGGSSTYRITGTVIRNNTLSGHPSECLGINEWSGVTHVYENLIYDGNSQIRFNSCNAPGESNRVVYVYRNRFVIPLPSGDHVFPHLDPTTTNALYFPNLWFYHNSFNGGRDTFQPSSYAVAAGGDQNMRWVNNLLSGADAYITATAAYMTNASMMGAYDYNLLADTPGSAGAWWGSSNIVQAGAEWATNDTTLALGPSSAAIGAALDVSQPFTLQGVNYPALPMTSAPKHGTAWDIGANEYVSFRMRANGMRVGTLRQQ